MSILVPTAPSQLTGVKKWEWSIRDLLFGGARSDVGVDRVQGLGSPEIRTTTNSKLQADGALVFARFLGPRTLVFSGTVFGRSDLVRRNLLAQMDVAFTPSDVDVAMYLKMGDGILKVIYVRPTRFDFDGDFGLARGVVHWAAEFIAGDPRFYDANQTMVTIESPPAQQPGHGFPHGFPLGFGGSIGGYGLCTNDGTFPTLPVITIHGPATNPFVRHVDLDVSMDLTLGLGASDVLVLDFANRTITLNGESSRYYALDAGSIWWELAPGDNLIQYGGGGFAEVAFQSAWRAA
jgi:hypothetical protein